MGERRQQKAGSVTPCVSPFLHPCFADSKVVVIDFGLAFTSTVVEDKAVDLYVLEVGLQWMHWDGYSVPSLQL